MRSRGWCGGGGLVAAVVALALAGCGSSSSGPSSTAGASSSAPAATSSSAATAPTTSSAATASDSGLAHAQQVVASHRDAASSYDLPTQPVKDVASLKGKTVMYIPLINAIPAFQIVAGSLKTALGKVGVGVEVCNGGANPTTVAACISQAKSQGDGGIVTDAIPFGMAAEAFKTASSSGIPVLIADQIAQPGTVNGSKLNYQPGNIDQPTLIADWIIADSKGKANAIIGEEMDSPSAQAYISQGLQPEFSKYCSSCSITIQKVTQSAPDQIASATNSAILKDPGIQYYYTEFEDDLQGVLQGIQQSGKISSIKVEAATATIAGLQKLKAGQSVGGEVGDDVNYEGWADADDILRMMVKQPVVTEKIPERIFDHQNIGSIKLTPAAQASGEWYGDPKGFEDGFTKLWGAS
jgi:ribose transport system substrate-binding protein